MTTRRVRRKSRLDEELYASKIKEATDLAVQTLSKYRGPAVPLEQLREEITRQLPNTSLSEFLLEERAAGY